MSNPASMKFYPIKGKVILSREERIFPPAETVVQAIQDHLKKQGLWKVKQETSRSVSFHGWHGHQSGFLRLNTVVGIGITTISMENSQMVAHYYLRPSFIFTLGTMLPLLILIMGMSMYRAWFSVDWLFSLAMSATITFSIIYFPPRIRMKQELKRAFRTVLDRMDEVDVE